MTKVIYCAILVLLALASTVRAQNECSSWANTMEISANIDNEPIISTELSNGA